MLLRSGFSCIFRGYVTNKFHGFSTATILLLPMPYAFIKLAKHKTNIKLIIYLHYVFTTVDPVYSERGYSEYPLIVNGFLRTDR